MRRRDPPPNDPRQFLESDSAAETCGILRWTSPRPELNLVLELFLRELTGRLFHDVQSVLLFGGAVHDDLGPAHDPIDLLVLVRREPGEAMKGEASVIHRYFGSPAFAPWGAMIDARYFPPGGLAEGGRGGRGLRGHGETLRRCDRSDVTPLDLLSIHQHGVVLYGQDLRKPLPRPQPRDLVPEVERQLELAAALGDGSPQEDWIATCTVLPQALHALDQGRPVSKAEAARWFAGLVSGRAGDAALEADRLRRGELRTGIGGLRRLVPLLVEAVRAELARVVRERGLATEPGERGG